jgi:hypothetical protein
VCCDWPTEIVHSQLIGSCSTLVTWRRRSLHARQCLTLDKKWQLYDCTKVIMTVDTGVTEMTVYVVFYATNYDVRVERKQCDER